MKKIIFDRSDYGSANQSHLVRPCDWCRCLFRDFGVWDSVWRDEAKLAPLGGSICQLCLEKRLGRKLTWWDWMRGPRGITNACGHVI